MQNLANSRAAQADPTAVRKADVLIECELRRCGIQIVRQEQPTMGEVVTHLTGKLGPFRFTRAWTYWVMKGPMPLRAAQALYASPVGMTDVRAGGDAGCAPPDRYATWRMEDGREVVPSKQEADFDRFHLDKSRFVFLDAPFGLEVALFVGTYHVDSELGLYVLAEQIRQLQPVELPRIWTDYE
jgi:hypothetical protein